MRARRDRLITERGKAANDVQAGSWARNVVFQPAIPGLQGERRGVPSPEPQARFDEAQRKLNEMSGDIKLDAKAQEEQESAKSALASAGKLNAAKQEEIEKNEKTLAQERESLQLQRDKYAALTDALKAGEQQGKRETDAFDVGRNSTEKLLTEARATGGLETPREVAPLTPERDPYKTSEGVNPRKETLPKSRQELDVESYQREIEELKSYPRENPDGSPDAKGTESYRTALEYLLNGKRKEIAEINASNAAAVAKEPSSAPVSTPSDRAEVSAHLGGLLADPARRYEAAKASGNGEEQNRAAGEILQLSNRLTEIQLSLEERRYKIQAEITNERRKENEEASKALAFADRESQLRAALLTRYEQKNGKFSEAGFQFLDQSSKEAVKKFTPDALPAEAGNKVGELESERKTLETSLAGLSAAVRQTADYINKNVKVSTTPPVGQGIPAPPQITPPNLTFTFGDQFNALAQTLVQQVNTRLDGEIASMRATLAHAAFRNPVNPAQTPGVDVSAGN